MPPTLGYWNLRGLAEPIRTMLSYTGTEYEEKTYELGPAPDFDRSDWFNVKHKLGLTLPNLPYYIDGNLNLTETTAILRHLARKNNLYGETEEDKSRIDMAASFLTEQLRGIIKLIVLNPDYENALKTFISDLSNQMEKISSLLSTGDYIAGAKISFVDFMLFEMLDSYSGLSADCLTSFPAVLAYQKRMAALPGVKARRDSANFKKIQTRLYGPMCSFGAGTESY